MKIKDIAFWIMIIFVIGLCIYLFTYIRGESSKCLASPLTYGANLIKDPDGNSISCRCTSKGLPDANIYFDNKNITFSYKPTAIAYNLRDGVILFNASSNNS